VNSTPRVVTFLIKVVRYCRLETPTSDPYKSRRTSNRTDPANTRPRPKAEVNYSLPLRLKSTTVSIEGLQGRGARTEDGDERAAPVVLGVRGEEAVDADLLLRHHRLEERRLGEAESTRVAGGRLLGRRRRGGGRRHRGGRDTFARARAPGRNRCRAGVADGVEWCGAGGDSEEEAQVGVGNDGFM
jgi:hypothetical protein